MTPIANRHAIDWDAYLAGFHTSHPGITEDVLTGSVADGLNPYQWLLDGVSPDVRIVDLGCGSGSARPPAATQWTGIDLSASEIRRAHQRGRASLILGQATQLALADDSIDLITCSMSMMLIHPLTDTLEEIRRVLHSTGELRLLLPARGPLTAADRANYLRLFWAARSPTRFPPSPMRNRAAQELAGSSLQVRSDERRRFDLTIASPSDADRLINSWYLPNISPKRQTEAHRRAQALAPTTLGIPLRRIIAKLATPGN